MEDNDTQALRLAGAAVLAIDVAYRQADGPDQFAMSGARDQAWLTYALARQKLLLPGVITTDETLAEIDALAGELARAANLNAMAGSAVKLASLLARIALA